MDVIPDNTSALVPIPSQDVHLAPQSLSPKAHSFFVEYIGIALFIGVLLGVMTAMVLIWFPYNRIVVLDQPWASTIRMSSVRLKRGGFVVFYLQEEQGWRRVAQTVYLPPGYYQNFVVGVDIDLYLPKIWNHFIARLYEDTGDYEFQEMVDVPVRDVFGNVYTKHFWFAPSRNYRDPIQYALERISFQPVSLLIDILFP